MVVVLLPMTECRGGRRCVVAEVGYWRRRGRDVAVLGVVAQRRERTEVEVGRRPRLAVHHHRGLQSLVWCSAVLQQV